MTRRNGLLLLLIGIVALPWLVGMAGGMIGSVEVLVWVVLLCSWVVLFLTWGRDARGEP
jgi:hypothetical protein